MNNRGRLIVAGVSVGRLAADNGGKVKGGEWCEAYREVQQWGTGFLWTYRASKRGGGRRITRDAASSLVVRYEQRDCTINTRERVPAFLRTESRRVKSLAQGTTMGSTPRVISVAASATFDAIGTHRCVHSSATPPPHAIRLAFLLVNTIFALAIGCARIQPTVSSVQTTQTTRQAVIDRIVDASVKVAIERDARRVRSASGIVIASRPAGQDTEAVSYVLTAAHVLAGRDGATIWVGFSGPHAARGKFAATVISQGKPDTLDLALLRVSGIAVPPVRLPEDDRARVGEQIVVVGFPEGQRLGIFGGIVSQLPFSELQDGIPADRAEHRIVIDAAAPTGVSGGGVFGVETGRLIGIVQGHQTFSIVVKDHAGPYALKFPVPGETFVVPMTQIRSFLRTPEVANELPGADTSALVSPSPG
jgi:serine protease Do